MAFFIFSQTTGVCHCEIFSPPPPPPHIKFPSLLFYFTRYFNSVRDFLIQTFLELSLKLIAETFPLHSNVKKPRENNNSHVFLLKCLRTINIEAAGGKPSSPSNSSISFQTRLLYKKAIPTLIILKLLDPRDFPHKMSLILSH